MRKSKLNYLFELKAALFGRAKPSMVSVNLTEKCNQNCVYCEIGKERQSSEKELLTKNDLFWIVDQMWAHGLKKLSLCGGEPFLFPEITDIVKYAWKKNIRCNITSNGMIIYRLPEEELNILSDCKTQINISIDSFKQEIQTKTRGNRVALENALRSINTLKRYDISVTQLAVISRYNFNDLFDSFVSAYKLGIEEVLYQPIIYYSNYPEKEVLKYKNNLNVPVTELEKLNEQLEKIYTFEKRHKIKTNVYRLIPWINEYIKIAFKPGESRFYHKVVNKFHCREAFAVIDISYYGGIQPCGLALAEKSIKEEQVSDLLAFWSETTAKFKNDLMQENYPMICNGCCHKFSRNMLASIMKYPVANRQALILMALLLTQRLFNRISKRIGIIAR